MLNRSSPSVRIFYPRWTKEKLIEHLREKLPLLASLLPLVRVVLFGSYATGRFTASSDIDLLVVHEGAPRADAYALIRKTLNVAGLEPHVYTRDEAARIQSTVERMERSGIILFTQTSPRDPRGHP